MFPSAVGKEISNPNILKLLYSLQVNRSKYHFYLTIINLNVKDDTERKKTFHQLSDYMPVMILYYWKDSANDLKEEIDTFTEFEREVNNIDSKIILYSLIV